MYKQIFRHILWNHLFFGGTWNFMVFLKTFSSGVHFLDFVLNHFCKAFWIYMCWQNPREISTGTPWKTMITQLYLIYVQGKFELLCHLMWVQFSRKQSLSILRFIWFLYNEVFAIFVCLRVKWIWNIRFLNFNEDDPKLKRLLFFITI